MSETEGGEIVVESVADQDGRRWVGEEGEDGREEVGEGRSVEEVGRVEVGY